MDGRPGLIRAPLVHEFGLGAAAASRWYSAAAMRRRRAGKVRGAVMAQSGMLAVLDIPHKKAADAAVR